MAKIDLHIHSHCSDDGEFPVEKILELGKQAGLEYMAITDHNTVRGVGQAVALGAKLGIEVVSGVELDCTHQGCNLHLLGYHFDYTNPTFGQIEESILTQLHTTAGEMISLIRQTTGIPITDREVLGAAGEGSVTGELIAELLLGREDAESCPLLLPYLPGGARDDNPYVNFYWDYFAQGRAAYVPINFISLQQAVELIHTAGGVAVLAHPGQNLRGQDELLQSVIRCGIDGIEAFSSYHSQGDVLHYSEAAAARGLPVTCGSDFHGKTKPAISLGGHGAQDTIIPSLVQAGVINGKVG